MKNKKEKYTLPCMQCDNSTVHKVLHSVETSESSPDEDVTVSSEFQIVQCLGCRSVSFRSNWQCSEDFNYVDNLGTVEYINHEEL